MVEQAGVNGLSKNAAGKNHTQVKCRVGKMNADELTGTKFGRNEMACTKKGCIELL